MLKHFKKFANWIDSKRAKGYDFREMVVQQATTSKRILEVGCNVRPINSKSDKYVLDGLDPDSSIQASDTNSIFDNFYNSTIEDLKSDKQYDLVVMNMVFEHIEDNNLTADKLKSLLSKNGKVMIHIPSNLHPFTIINQILPHNLKLKVLRTLRPWAGVGVISGWRSYYHKCNIMSIRSLFKSKNMSVKSAYFRYRGSDYFAFFPPLFILIVLFEEFLSFFNVAILCSHLVVVVGHDS